MIQRLKVARKSAANEDLESMEIPAELLLLILTPTRSCRVTLCKITSINWNNILKIKNCPNSAATPVWRLLKKDNFFIALHEEGPRKMKNPCREYTLPRREEASRVEVWILGNTKIGPVLDVKICFH